MAYETGTFTSMADLKSKMITFLTGNGWTAEGSNIVKKNGVFAELIVGSDTGAGAWAGKTRNYIRLRGGKSSDGGGNLVAIQEAPVATMQHNSALIGDAFHFRGAGNEFLTTRFGIAEYPATYFFHLASSPVDEFWCFTKTDTQFHKDIYQRMGFGNIVKAADFTGGGFYDASFSEVAINTPSTPGGSTWREITIKTLAISSSTGHSLMPFGGVYNALLDGYTGSCIHAEVAGFDWLFGAQVTGVYSSSRPMLDHRMLYEERKYSQSKINGTLSLIPFRIFCRVPNENYQRIGHLENLRFCKITNVEPEQVENDGTDGWKFYPLFRKDATNDADSQINSSDDTGTFGLAVKYDGP